MPVEVNEAGGEDESGTVNFRAAFEGSFADGGDFAGGDGDVADGVEAAFGVEDACGFDYQIVWGLGEQAEGQEETDEIAHQGERIAFHGDTMLVEDETLVAIAFCCGDVRIWTDGEACRLSA